MANSYSYFACSFGRNKFGIIHRTPFGDLYYAGAGGFTGDPNGAKVYKTVLDYSNDLTSCFLQRTPEELAEDERAWQDFVKQDPEIMASRENAKSKS